MLGRTFKTGMVATLLGLLIVGPVAALVAPSPAYADGECCQVGIDSLPGQFRAGGDPMPFVVHITNQSQETLRYLDVAFVLQADGLVGDLVRLQRRRATGDPHNVGTFTQRGVHSGVVTAGDQLDLGMLALPPGGGADIEYQLSFNKKVPGSALTVSLMVQPRRSNGSLSSAGPYHSTILAEGQPAQNQPGPTPSAAVSDTPATTDATDVAQPPTDQSSLLGGGTAGDGGGSLMWLAYTIGGLLLLGGVGVIGTLLWRRGPHRFETDPVEPEYGQQSYPTRTYGGYAPTQVATYGTPRPATGAETPTRIAPAVYRPTDQYPAPTAHFPTQRAPFADPDQTWFDPDADRQA
jgi:hypothetical protein